jgi:hypothetical protein
VEFVLYELGLARLRVKRQAGNIHGLTPSLRGLSRVLGRFLSDTGLL